MTPILKNTMGLESRKQFVVLQFTFYIGDMLANKYAMRQFIDIVQSPGILTEAFVASLKPTYNAEKSAALSTVSSAISQVYVYDVEYAGMLYEIQHYFYNGAYEVHFDNVTNGRDKSLGQLPAGTVPNPLFAEGMALYKRRLDKGKPIRYFAKNERLMMTYKKMFDFMNRSKYNGSLVQTPEPDNIDAAGVHVPAMLVQVS